MLAVGFIGDEDIRRVREASDLVEIASGYVNLQQRGRDFWAVCPFHDDRNPSLKIDPSMQLWHCFGCGKGGDVFAWLKEAEGLEFPEAVRELADRAHIEIAETGGRRGPGRDEKERLMRACEEAAAFFHMQLMRSKADGASKARAYLHGRGFGSGPSKDWQLGFAPGRGSLVAHLKAKGFTTAEMVAANLAVERTPGRPQDRFFERVMFPVRDLRGRAIAFGGRVVGEGEPKYLNSSETPIFHKSSNLFAIDRAKPHIVADKRAVVVEGYTDAIALHEAGIACTVATLGTALTPQHLKMLGRFTAKIVYLFDGDAAGQKAADRAAGFIDWRSAVESGRNPIELAVVVLPDNLDPAEFVAARGAGALRELLDGAVPLLEFSIKRRLDAFDLRVPENKVAAMKAALEVLAPLKGSVTATDYINLIADRLNLDYTDVSQALDATRAPVAARHQAEDAPPQTGGHPADRVAERIIEADQKSMHMEYELIGLVVSDAGLLDSIGDELACVRWTGADAERIVEALRALPHTASPAECFAAAQQASDAAARLLSSAMPQVDNAQDALYRARVLVHALRERDLERQIRQGKARLRDEGSLDEAAVGELFEKTVRLQKELAHLRGTLGADALDGQDRGDREAGIGKHQD